MIVYFIFTIDNDFEDEVMDLIKDFAALVILIDLDNTLIFDDPVPNYDIYEELQVKGPKSGEDENLPELFMKSVEFQKHTL